MTKHVTLQVDASELAAAVRARHEVLSAARTLEKSLVRLGFAHCLQVSDKGILLEVTLPPLPVPRPVVEVIAPPPKDPETQEKLDPPQEAASTPCRPRVGPDLTPPDHPVAKRWSKAETDRLVALVEAGCAHDEIVTALRRPSKQVTNKKDRLRADGVLPRARPRRSVAPQRPELSRAARALDAHLDALGYTRPWSPARDYRLAQMLCAGHPAAVVSEQIRLALPTILKRYQALNQLPEDLDYQKLLLERLRARAEGK